MLCGAHITVNIKIILLFSSTSTTVYVRVYFHCFRAKSFFISNRHLVAAISIGASSHLHHRRESADERSGQPLRVAQSASTSRRGERAPQTAAGACEQCTGNRGLTLMFCSLFFRKSTRRSSGVASTRRACAIWKLASITTSSCESNYNNVFQLFSSLNMTNVY